LILEKYTTTNVYKQKSTLIHALHMQKETLLIKSTENHPIRELPNH